MPIVPGQSLTHYEILGPLGAGAMGEVYRARDTRLEREVAIKVLPEHFADDEERLVRFEREAKSLASLNHPNVAQIHGVDQVEDLCFLVLELVPGETLEDRIARGPLPLDEALDVGRQIAEGLEAAHEAGVIHRDLKPANVRLTPDGKVKVLDFGLAKAGGPAASRASTVAGNAAGAASDSVLSTEAGRLLGTPTYMAPEQARGKPIDRRVDVWAFGCVLFECITGRRAFAGETLSDVLASVLEKEPDWSALPDGIPAPVRDVVERCLVKDPFSRLRDMGDARLELSRERVAGGGAEHARARASNVRTVGLVIAGVAFGAMFVGAMTGFRSEPESRPEVSPRRFALTGIDQVVDAFEGLAISPDGRNLVYRARDDDGSDRLHVRSLDSFETRSLEGTDFGWLPFFSPDGESIGFYGRNRVATMSLSGGAVRSIVPLDGGFTGGVWLEDDSIVVGHDGTLGIVAPGGSSLDTIVLDDPSITVVASPGPLPRPRAILCAVRRDVGFDAVAVTLDDGKVHAIVPDAFTPTYVRTGHVLFQQGEDGPLMAIGFDLETLTTTGPAFPVASGVGTRISYQARVFSIANDGTLAYIPQTGELSNGTLLWVDLEGRSTEITTRPSVVFGPRLSSDGERIAFRTPAVDCDLWVHDLVRGGTSRITKEGDNHGIAWGNDDRLLFARSRESVWDVLSGAADGAGDVQRLSVSDIEAAHVSSCSPEGDFVLVSTRREATGGDIAVLDVASGEVRPLVATRFEEGAARFSPDGRYVAYVSDESGESEVYVQPFPSLSERSQVSTDGGAEPVWAPTGDKLFYRNAGWMMVAAVKTEPTFTAERPLPLFEDVFARRGAAGLPDYDVNRDGTKLVMVRERQREGGGQIHVVLHWFEELLAAQPRGD